MKFPIELLQMMRFHEKTLGTSTTWLIFSTRQDSTDPRCSATYLTRTGWAMLRCGALESWIKWWEATASSSQFCQWFLGDFLRFPPVSSNMAGWKMDHIMNQWFSIHKSSIQWPGMFQLAHHSLPSVVGNIRGGNIRGQCGDAHLQVIRKVITSW